MFSLFTVGRLRQLRLKAGHGQKVVDRSAPNRTFVPEMCVSVCVAVVRRGSTQRTNGEVI